MRASLGQQLIALVVLVALVSGGAVGMVAVERARSALRDDVLRQSLATADLAAALVTSYMADAEGDAGDLASQSAIRSVATRGDLSAANPELERWLPGHPKVTSVRLVDLTGVARATSLENKSLVDHSESADRDWFDGVLKTDQPYLGLPGRSNVSNRPRVPYGVPVHDSDGNLRAVLVTNISLEELANTLNKVQAGAHARAALVDLEHDLILSHADPKRILEPTERNTSLAQLDAGERGATEAVSSSGQTTLAAFAPVEGFRWGVLIQQPSEDAFRPVDEIIRNSELLIAAVVGLAATLGAGLAISLSRPLRRLRASAEAMAAGDLSQRNGMSRKDEVGDLGRAFDHMAVRLQTTLAELQEGEERFRGLVGATFDGVAIHSNTTLLEVNAEFASLFCYTAHELVGRSILDLATPESIELIKQKIAEDSEERFEIVGLRKDGTQFSAQVVGKTCTYAGRPARITAMRDITTARRAASERAQMAAIVQSSQDAIVGKTPDGLVTSWNAGAERLYGYSAAEMLGQSTAHLVPAERLAEAADAMARVKKGEHIERLETTRVRKDGQIIEVALAMSPILDSAGNVGGVAVIAHDITDRKRAEAILQHQA